MSSAHLIHEALSSLPCSRCLSKFCEHSDGNAMPKGSEAAWLPAGPWWMPDEPSLQENRPGGGEEEGDH